MTGLPLACWCSVEESAPDLADAINDAGEVSSK
jgi:hypothetical protein